MGQVTGTVFIYVNGDEVQAKDGAKLNTGGKERTPIVANGRVVGYSEKTVPATLECTVPHTASTDIEEMNDWKDATLTFECDTGVSYLIINAFTTKPCEVTSGEGDMSLAMAGEPAIEQ